MKHAILILFLAVLSLAGQDRFTSRDVDTDPVLIPATLTAVFTFTVYVAEITLTNETDAAVTVTIQDRQSTPRALFKDLSIAAKTTYVVPMNGRKFPGGIAWAASSATAVTGYIQGKR
jgi:hypothetical protein